MQLSRRKIIQALMRKGFIMHEASHHTYFIYVYLNGAESKIETRVSRGSKSKTIGDDLISRMAKQLGLTRAQFIDLINCPLSREGYEAIISAK